MSLGNDYVTISLNRQTFTKLKTEADLRGMKLYALADNIVNQFFQQEGEQLN